MRLGGEGGRIRDIGMRRVRGESQVLSLWRASEAESQGLRHYLMDT